MVMNLNIFFKFDYANRTRILREKSINNILYAKIYVFYGKINFN